MAGRTTSLTVECSSDPSNTRGYAGPDRFAEHSEATMQAFIKHQMMVILQPFLDNIQAQDTRLARADEQFRELHGQIAQCLGDQDRQRAEALDLRTELRKTNAAMSQALDGLDRCTKQQDDMRKSFETHNGHARELQDLSKETETALQQLQRRLLESDCELKAMKTRQQSTDDSISSDIRGKLQQLAMDAEEMRRAQAAGSSELAECRKDIKKEGQLLHETRQVLDATRTHAAGLQKAYEDLAKKEAELGGRLEGWKAQWSKLHPAIEGLRKDTSCLAQRCEHFDTVIFGLTQQHATAFSAVEAMQGDLHRQALDVQALRTGTDANSQGIAQARDEMKKAGSQMESLQTKLAKTDADVRKAAMRAEMLESKQVSLGEDVSAANGSVGEAMREHRRLTGMIQAMRCDVDKTNDTLTGTRGQLEATNAGLRGLKEDLGSTTSTVQKLGQHVESFRAGFTGLQRGFVDTGLQMASGASSRPGTGMSLLPKLPGGQTPRPGREENIHIAAASHEMCGTSGPRAPLASNKAVTCPSAGEPLDSGDFDVSQASTRSQNSSRRSSEAPSWESSRRTTVVVTEPVQTETGRRTIVVTEPGRG